MEQHLFLFLSIFMLYCSVVSRLHVLHQNFYFNCSSKKIKVAFFFSIVSWNHFSVSWYNQSIGSKSCQFLLWVSKLWQVNGGRRYFWDKNWRLMWWIKTTRIYNFGEVLEAKNRTIDESIIWIIWKFWK